MKTNFFKDMLKSKIDGGFKFSQGRVYLLIFIALYIICLVYFLFMPNISSMDSIIDALQWAIFLFAAYVFGGKGIDATKQIYKGKRINIKEEEKETKVTKNDSSLIESNGGKEEDLCA
jgi:amino acid permease